MNSPAISTALVFRFVRTFLVFWLLLSDTY